MQHRSHARPRLAAAAAATVTTLALAVAHTAVHAQSNYPTKPIRMIIPFAPGGASDFVGRIIAQPLGLLLGQQVIADNRPGASGNIGLEAAARAPGDGYTIFQGNIGTLAVNPGIYPTLQVKPTRDFAPIAQVVDVADVLVTHPSLPVKNVKELVAFAKARKGQLNFASPGSGSFNRLEMEYFIRAVGIDMVHVPYKGGAGPAVTAMVSGETVVMFTTVSSAVSFVKANRLRALGVTTPKRISALPDTATMKDQGIDMTSGSWQGVLLPAKAPKEIVDRLHAALMKVMAQPEVKKRLEDGGAQVVTSGPDEFGRLIAAETDRWTKVIKDAGVTAE
jgi:tripartite-type tricarboxylate transporter receptor subunit TctC